MSKRGILPPALDLRRSKAKSGWGKSRPLDKPVVERDQRSTQPRERNGLAGPLPPQVGYANLGCNKKNKVK